MHRSIFASCYPSNVGHVRPHLCPHVRLFAGFLSCSLFAILLFGTGAPTAQASGDDAAAAEKADPSLSRWTEQAPRRLPTTTDRTDRETFQLPKGFQIEQLFDVPKDTHGSWVSMAFDPQGRLIVSDQKGLGLFRVTIPEPGTHQMTRVEKLQTKMTAAQGLLHAFDSLYVSVNGGPGSGLYRLRDTDGDDQYDEQQLLSKFDGRGEHGPHSVRLNPEGTKLIVVCGNHTDPPADLTATRMLPNWQEDLLLPRQWDARGHARGRLAPGGWIAETDPDGKRWGIISIGYRNVFDFDFGPDGDIFAYDADMEWDFGLPWYRPTRLVHAIGGSEFGWRSGTGKWPAYYADSLPAVVNIGPGSPTGVVFGKGLDFPTTYQRAFFLLDWTFGTMYAVHLTPEGSSYRGKKEEFLSRGGLPLTDAAVGPDGALYFAVGGRNTESALYRVRYVGDQSTAAPRVDPQLAELRTLRRKLESFLPGIDNPNPGADIELLLLALGHSDRHIRYVARTVLEHQPMKIWQDALAADASPTRRIELAIALAHAGSLRLKDDDDARLELKNQVVTGLQELTIDRLSLAGKRDLLRALALTFIRLGPPSTQQAAELVAELEPLFPSDNQSLNHELARILVYLNAPSIVQRALALMERPSEPPEKDTTPLLDRNPGYGRTIAKMLRNHPELDKLHYAFLLRNMRYGWTLEERQRYFDWLEQAKQRSGGMSYVGFLENIRKDALENMSDDERALIVSGVNPTSTPPVTTEELPKPQGPGREWTQSEILQLARTRLYGRNFSNGKRMFAAARCIVCHRFDGVGGATGPDLTSVAGRFGLKDLTEAILKPSKVISDQYRAHIIETSDGQVFTGRVLSETQRELTVETNPEDATQVETIPKNKIDSMEPSPVSLMPKNLLNELNEQEVLDLLAYLLSRGNPQDLMFQGATP